MNTFRFFLLFLLVVFLTACAAPAVPAQTSTPKAPTAIRQTRTPTLTVTPDATLGKIEGNLYWQPSGSEGIQPIPDVTLQLERHSGEYLKMKVRSQADGHFIFYNVEPGEYGFGLYLNLQLGERKCEAPEYIYSRDLKWLHYSTWSKVDVWYDVIFSSVDLTINLGETTVLDFTLKCP